MKQLALPEDIPGTEFVKTIIDGQEYWKLPDFATVAEWRDMQQSAITGDDKHALRQFRAATLMLELAARHGVPARHFEPLLQALARQGIVKGIFIHQAAARRVDEDRPLRQESEFLFRHQWRGAARHMQREHLAVRQHFLEAGVVRRVVLD